MELMRGRMIDMGVDPEDVSRQMAAAGDGGMTGNTALDIALAVALMAALGALVGALAARQFQKGGPATDAAV